MKTGKSTSWLGEWHWVSTNKDQKSNKLDQSNQEIIEWCEKEFGKSSSRWFEKGDTFFFKNEKDMALFILKWS